MFSTSAKQLPCEVLVSRLGPDRTRQLVAYGGRDSAIEVYPFASYSAAARLDGLGAPVTAIAFDRRQQKVVGGSDVGTLRLWDISTEQTTSVFNGHRSTITDLDVHKGGDILATVSTDRRLRVWDVRAKLSRQAYTEAKSPLCTVLFSPDGKWIASGCAQGVVRLYNLSAAKEELKLELHSGAITSLHFHPEYHYLAVGSGDGTISVWNLDSSKPRLHSSTVHTPIDKIHFCGSRLLAASDHSLRCYDVENLLDEAVETLDAPWTMIGDLVYASSEQEAWFVETNGSSSLTGRIQLGVKTQQHMQPGLSAGPSGRLNLSSPVNSQSKQRLKTMTRASTPSAVGSKKSSIPGSPLVSLSSLSSAPRQGPSEYEEVEHQLRASATMGAHLHRRLAHIRVFRSLWATDKLGALQYVRQICVEGTEGGVAHDVLIVMQQQRMKECTTAEMLPELLHIVHYALRDHSDPMQLAALRILRFVNTKFRARMEEGQRRARASQSNGHNDPFGLGNHSAVLDILSECSQQVLKLTERRDAVGNESRILATELPPPAR